MLLRADVHRLYDAGLCAVDPESFEIVFSDKVGDASYHGDFGGRRARLPRNEALWPDYDELEVHMKEFLLMNAG